MNPPVITARLREELQTGPKSAAYLIKRLGIERTKLHKLIHRHGARIVRVDGGVTHGPHARPVYRWCKSADVATVRRAPKPILNMVCKHRGAPLTGPSPTA